MVLYGEMSDMDIVRLIIRIRKTMLLLTQSSSWLARTDPDSTSSEPRSCVRVDTSVVVQMRGDSTERCAETTGLLFVCLALLPA